MLSSQPPFSITWDELNRIIRLVWADGVACCVGGAVASTEAISVAGSGEFGVLVDMRGVASIDREARQHYTRDQGGAHCVALLAGSPKTRMIANFFIGVQRLKVPIRMFTDEHSATEWIQSVP